MAAGYHSLIGQVLVTTINFLLHTKNIRLTYRGTDKGITYQTSRPGDCGQPETPEAHKHTSVTQTTMIEHAGKQLSTPPSVAAFTFCKVATSSHQATAVLEYLGHQAPRP